MARDAPPKPRLCHLRKWPDFAGYGFNLHAEKGKPGHYIGRVDEGSPAVAGGLRQGDRIVEVNGTNIGNENHQQVVARIQLVSDETKILVVGPEAEEFYRTKRMVVRGDMPEVELSKTPLVNPFTAPPAVTYKGKLCDLKVWSNFMGYGFNLHAEKGNPSHIIGKVDPKSPAEASEMIEGDRIIEVNGVNVLNESHSDVVRRIKSDPRKVTVLLVSPDCETFLRDQGMSIPSKLVKISHFVCPEDSPFITSANATQPVPSTQEETSEGSANNAPKNRTSLETKIPPVNSHNCTSSTAPEQRYHLCHMKRSEADAKSFGFTMHASKGQPGHFITEVDANSIAERSGLKAGNRVIEVNGVNVEKVAHKQVVDMIKAVSNETFLLVINDSRDHDCSMESKKTDGFQGETDGSNKNKGNSIQNQNQEDDAEDSISTDYRLITDEMIEVAEREAKTVDQYEASQRAARMNSSPENNNSCMSCVSAMNSSDASKSDEAKKSPVVVSGIEFASSAEEARRRMVKKSRVKDENLSIRDKFRLFERL